MNVHQAAALVSPTSNLQGEAKGPTYDQSQLGPILQCITVPCFGLSSGVHAMSVSQCLRCLNPRVVEKQKMCSPSCLQLNEGGQLRCVTEHDGFQAVCLNVHVLETAYYGYRQDHGDHRDARPHKRYRYTAYRQFVRWCSGYIGKNIRVPLPSCVVNAIRRKYPSGDYEGVPLATCLNTDYINYPG